MADYLEGHLSLEKRALFDAHLDDCGTCMSEIRDVQRTVNLLRSLPEPEVPAGFTDSVMRRVREADDRPHWLRSVSEAFSMLLRPRILVPVSVSMIALGILAGTGQVEDALLLETPARGQLAGPAQSADASALAGVPGTAMRLPAEQTSQVPRGAAIHIAVQPTSASSSLPGPFQPTNPGQGQIVHLVPRQFSPAPGQIWNASAPVQPMVMQAAVGSQARWPADSGLGSSNQARRSARQPSADEWLLRLRRSPGNFATLISNSTLAEQELWVSNLARRAAERGELDEVVQALRASPNQRAKLLADDFEAYGRGPRAQVLPSGRSR